MFLSFSNLTDGRNCSCMMHHMIPIPKSLHQSLCYNRLMFLEILVSYDILLYNSTLSYFAYRIIWYNIYLTILLSMKKHHML